MLDKETAQNLSRELKIDLFTIYREYLQLLFLKYFYLLKGGESVYFKGGTALRFLFNSFRFSEDLDFSSILKKQDLKNLIAKTLQSLNRELPNLTFKEGKTFKDSLSGKIYQVLPEFKFSLTIRLDFSMREKTYHPETSLIETNFPVGPYPQVIHLKAEEIMAEKVRAVLARTKGRDIFDLWFLLSKKILVDWDLVNDKMKIYNESSNLKRLINSIEKASQKEIEFDLRKFLPTSHRNILPKIKDLTLEKLQGLQSNLSSS